MPTGNDDAAGDTQGTRNHLVFFVNGAKQVVKDAQPQTTLLQHLRAAGLTGTKLGCGEGGCGACTVMVSSFDSDKKQIKHAAVNACLAPVCSVDWCHVTTVEGVGTMRQGLHPVQKRIAEMHGSQCGFCTPGIVMALYALLRSNPSATPAEIEDGLDGNLCRCTGYRPILDAAKSLGVDGGRRAGCCRGDSGGCPCLESKAETASASEDDNDNDTTTVVDDQDKDQVLSETSSILSTAATDGSAVPPSGPLSVSASGDDETAENEIAKVVGGGRGGGSRCSEKRECTTSRARDSRYSTRYTDVSEPIFPAELMLRTPSAVSIVGDSVTWHCPTSLSELLRLKAANPKARIVAGNTEVGIEVKFKGMHYPVLISPARVPELHAITRGSADDGGVSIGGAASLSSVEHALAVIDGRKRGAGGGNGGAAGACVDMLRWFASTQIRNVACLAGNLATASPISDMNPLLAACGADVVLNSIRGGERRIKVRDFFLGYRKVAMEEDEVIVAVFLPNAASKKEDGGQSSPPSTFEFIRPFKQARRREDDISIVTGGIRLVLEPRGGKWVVKEASMCFGGMAPTTVGAPLTEVYLVGKEWSAETMGGAYELLAQDMPLSSSVPGGQCEYRRALPPSFLFKFFIEVSLRLEALSVESDGQLPPPPVIGDADRSAATNFVTAPKPPSRGEQEYTPRTGGMQKARPQPHTPVVRDEEATGRTENTKTKKAALEGGVGDPVPHKSADLQVTGEAVYTDDMPSPVGTLFVGLVLSTKPHAKLLEVDASPALEVEGVLRFVGAGDVTPERNGIGAVVVDEEVFAVDEVHCLGQVIGAVLAESAAIAESAAKLVMVRYEELPSIMTIEDAIAADSYYGDRHAIVDGDVDSALKDADVVVEGEMAIGGQEHFYLETNATLAVPGEAGSLEVFASTQNPTKTQDFCSKVCGIDKNKVVCRTKRMGGGFGGKETRSVFLSCVAALGAHLTKRPVRICLDRDVDMQITGHRHAYLAKYKAGATKDGKLVGMDVTLYNNAGCSLDLSASVMDRALFHIDNCYSWPALRAKGLVCKTNQASHTAFRGFGGPQGMLVTETVMDHLASSLEMDSFVLRTLNLYKPEEPTHFGQPLEAWNVPAAWKDVQQWADIERRRKEVDAFNSSSRYRKRGLAVVPTKFGICFTAGFMNQGGALVHVYLDGTVLVSHGGTEMGQGLHTKVCQVVANEFNIDVEKVHISETATDRVANTSPTAASMSTDLYGMAALDACEQITERLRPVMAELPENSPFATIVKAAYFRRIQLSAQGFYTVPAARCGYDFDMETTNNRDRGLPFNYFTQGVAASEVEIDCLTGDAKVIRADILMDIGTSVNPAIDIGQIEGAFIQGYGWCTMEETSWGDSEHLWVKPGQLFTKGPGTYKIPSFNDVPSDMRVKLMDRANAFAVHSSKAVGEPPFFLASSAFLAIKDAVASARKDHNKGKASFFRLNSPASSERIRTACLDGIMERSAAAEDGEGPAHISDYQAKGSW
ncbi:conserved unknown protein [Ectocarpus siliculosus]|uniref:xanthine dehydrogenase n=1 Tax=Ectocarpus siliculosus TaxID=2880 RepID=D7G4V2_ECTSI|nr:conserved unknown protein [Ectocarpus siliculosus]|eukprot:CBJ27195.1 conserved unknown protein [Ectocarpus siliculosus]